MKSVKQLIPLFLLVFIISCSSDNETNTNENETTPSETIQENPLSGDFFPSAIGNEWNYDVQNQDSNTNDVIDSTDRLFVETSSNNSIKLGVNNNNIANGTMSGILANGTLSKSDITLSTTGELSFSVDGLDDINIPYNDAVLYNLEVPNNSELSTFSGTINQTIQSFPVTISYTLKTNQIKNWDTIELNGETYNNVTHSNFILNLKIDVQLPQVGNKPIVDQQDGLIINNYYGKNIGLIKTNADTDIKINSDTITLIESIPGVDTSQIPNDVSSKNSQKLTSFTIN